MKKIKSLLNQVSIITKLHSEIADKSGDSFNIFSVLKMETDEVRTHSRFIAELLNPKGSHNMGGIFLQKFISEIGQNIVLELESASVEVEFYTGKVTKDRGGNIDIIISDRLDNVIMIENKIYAGEQENQLLRYRNYKPNGVLIYLTLFGVDSTEKSSKKINYELFSYERNIINWLIDCQKETVETPLLRETLSQYINLIKKLTNQNTNTQLEADLSKILLNNEDYFDAFLALDTSKKKIKYTILKHTVIPIFKKVAIETDSSFYVNDEENFCNINGSWLGFNFDNEQTKKLGVSICFQANQAKHDGLNRIHFGIIDINDSKDDTFKKHTSIFNEFSQVFSYSKSSNLWICYTLLKDYNNLGNLETLKNIQFNPSAFEATIRGILIKIKLILDDY